nr:LPS export ABC transporter permease LptF [Magnetofaba australis]
MNRLSRYLLAECTQASLIALLVLTALVLLPQVLKLVDLWVNKSVSITILGMMTLLIIPKFLVASLPMALLVGTLTALGRLAQDSELTAMKASGVGLWHMIRPLALLPLAAALISLSLNWYWVPQAHVLFTQVKSALLASNTFSIKTQTFNQSIPGLTIYVHKQSQGGRLLEGLLIHDAREPDHPVTLVARSGALHRNSDGDTAILLREGSRHQSLPEGKFRQLAFATYDLPLGVDLGASSKEGDEERKITAFSGAQLLEQTQSSDPQQAYEAIQEQHRRLAIPIATAILGLLAIPLGTQHAQRTGRSYGLVVAVLVMIAQFVLLNLGEAMAKRHVVSPLVGLWSPNLIMALFTLYVLRLAHYDRGLRFADWLSQLLSVIPQRLLRKGPPASPRAEG